MTSRADYGKNADEWFASLDDTIAPFAMELRSIIQKAVPDAAECIKWGTPIYEKSGTICSTLTRTSML